MFKNEDTGLLAVGKFLAVSSQSSSKYRFHPLNLIIILSLFLHVFQALRTTGLRNDDPRLQEFTDNLRKEHLKTGGHEGVSHETQKLSRDQFRR